MDDEPDVTYEYDEAEHADEQLDQEREERELMAEDQAEERATA